MPRAVICMVLALSACGLFEDPNSQTPERGARLFAENCAACHGAGGAGGGPAALGLGQTPPPLTDLSARNNGTFPRTRVLAVLDGADRADDPDAIMPEFGAEEI